ncbi:MAG: FKBP-type peptidyl-prolyl cis-trans isomerase [Balneolales bacterium]
MKLLSNNPLLLIPALLLFALFLHSCDEDEFYEPDLSAVPEAYDTTGVDREELENGLVIYTHEEGSGDMTVSAGDNVAVRYTGRVITGEVFDSSWMDGNTNPAQFNLRNTIQGFPQGLEGLKEGSRVTLIIPPALGYGLQPPPSRYNVLAQIQPNATIVFDVDLIGILDSDRGF